MADINVEDILGKLTLSEKCSLLAGINLWHTKAIPKHGIPSLRLSDGPNGVRGTDAMKPTPGACFPCGTALGATFNQELLVEAGAKMGEEARMKGVHVILGPTVNIQRSPLGGRGFESIGEDPLLSGLAAAALIRGIQGTGVQACIKHFICNDQEHRRNASHSILSDRALREIYALPFQLAVRDANPGSFMTSYNGINGTYCSENKELLDGLLRKEWAWDGLVMSDWFGTYSTTEAAKAGLDLEMPGPSKFRGDLLRFNVATDKVWEHELDERVRAMLRFIKRCAQSGIPENAPEEATNTPETAALLRRIGGESLVLLKNDDDLLPLKKDKKTLIVGPNAKIAAYHGGGSASLTAYYAITPFDGIKSKLVSEPDFALGCSANKVLPLMNQFKTPGGAAGLRVRVFNEPPEAAGRTSIDEFVSSESRVIMLDYKNPKLQADYWYADIEGSFTAEEDCTWEFGVLVAGTAKVFVDGKLVIDNATAQRQGDMFFGAATEDERGTVELKKGKSYELLLQFGSGALSKLNYDSISIGGGGVRLGGQMVHDPKQEVALAAEKAKSADQVIICAGLNAAWEAEGLDREHMDMPGQMDDMIAAVAAANPNTVVVLQSGTPVTMPWVGAVRGIVQAWYGGNETGNAIADVLFGDVNPSGKLPLSFPISVKHNPAYLHYRTEFGRVWYGEDIYVGYRFYDATERTVLFPFGHGLSYTTFQLSDLDVSKDPSGKVTASVGVTNSGSREGKQVVQVYVSPKFESRVRRPAKELQGFTKVTLGPGETKRATVSFDIKYGASYFDESRQMWCVEAGCYDVIVSDSSAIKDGCNAVRGSVSVDETFYWTGL